MATATSHSMGVVNFASGSFTGAGAAVEVDTGFTPRYVRIFDKTNVIIWEKSEDMVAANCIKQVTAGTTTVETSSDIVMDDNGFTVSATLAASSAEIGWIAFA